MVTPKDRKKMRLKMKQKFEETQDAQGEDFVPEFDFYLDVPEGVKRWYPATGDTAKDPEGNHYFDIIPFWVGNNYPQSKKGGKKGRNIDVNCDEDDLYYKLDIWYHKKVGVDDLMVPCAYRNNDMPCPICEFVNEEYNNLETDAEKKDFWAANGAKRQTVYNVKVVNEDGESISDDIMLLNLPYPYMEERLKELSTPARGGKIYYADEEDGRTIFFKKVKDESYAYQLSAHELVPRNYTISEDDVDSAHQIDQFIKSYTYDEIKDLMAGKKPKKDKVVDDEPEPVPERKKKDRDMGDDVPMHDSKKSDPEPEKEEDEPDDEFADFKDDDGNWNSCPSEDEEPFGVSFDMYEECNDCVAKEACKEANKPKTRKKPLKKK